jgi:hypothetical protein
MADYKLIMPLWTCRLLTEDYLYLQSKFLPEIRIKENNDNNNNRCSDSKAF